LASPTSWKEICSGSNSKTDVGEAAAQMLTLNTNIGVTVEWMNSKMMIVAY
jgi:hypothetical protein